MEIQTAAFSKFLQTQLCRAVCAVGKIPLKKQRKKRKDRCFSACGKIAGSL